MLIFWHCKILLLVPFMFWEFHCTTSTCLFQKHSLPKAAAAVTFASSCWGSSCAGAVEAPGEQWRSHSLHGIFCPNESSVLLSSHRRYVLWSWRYLCTSPAPPACLLPRSQSWAHCSGVVLDPKIMFSWLSPFPSDVKAPRLGKLAFLSNNSFRSVFFCMFLCS
jgi:hypothetical protein